MSDDVTTVAPLEYAKPVDAPFSQDKARRLRWAACMPSGVGVFILVAFACTGIDFLAGLGALWLVLGGSAAFATATMALVMGILARKDGERSGRACREYWLAFLLSLLSVPVAAGCLVAGIRLMSWWSPDADL